MFDYEEPLRTDSPSGLWNLPFVVGFRRTGDTLVLFKGFARGADHNPLTFKVVGERKVEAGGVEYAVDTGAALPTSLRVYPLTTDYILANREKYPFDDAMLTGLLQDGNLSLYAQATIPEWYEEQYPPAAPPETQTEWKHYWSL